MINNPTSAIFNSRSVLLLWVLGFIVFLLFTDVWSMPGHRSVLSWDVFGYYAYLPSTILHQDLLHLEELHQMYHQYNPTHYFYAAHELENGNYVMSYTMGLAILYLPFFLLGHLAALVSGVPADSFSWPYQLAIYFGSGVYALLGLIVIRKVLLRYFTDGVVALCLLVLILATNYFFYSYIEIPMSHSYLFTLYALMLWFTIKWYETHKLHYAILLGFVIGFIVLMRPTEIVALLIPILWGVTDKKSAIAKVNLLWQYKHHLAILAFCTFLVGLPQLLYWKYATGQFLYYSYGGLGFDFLRPHLIDGIFSWRKGWLIYTPAMVFAIVGFWPLYKHRSFMFWGMALYALINVYIVFSWSVWYYGGGFGARAMVQSYAVMLFPLGAFFTYQLQRRFMAWGVGALLVFFVVLNLFQIWQYNHRMYSTEGMTPYVYKLLFFNTHVTKADIMAIEHKEHLPPNHNLQQQILKTLLPSKTDSLAILPNAPEYIVLDTVMPQSFGNWIQLRFDARFDKIDYSYHNLAKAQIKFLDADSAVLKKAQVRIQNLIEPDVSGNNNYFGLTNFWERITFESQIPKNTTQIIVLFRNPGTIATVHTKQVTVSYWE